MSHADDLQAVSVDEALIDVTTTVNQLRTQARNDDIDTPHDPAKDFAETIRAQVREATSCEGSFHRCDEDMKLTLLSCFSSQHWNFAQYPSIPPCHPSRQASWILPSCSS